MPYLSPTSSPNRPWLNYQNDLPTFEGAGEDTGYNAPTFNDRGTSELWRSIGAGDFDVSPVDAYQDAFIQNMMSGVTAEGRRAGNLQANNLMRSQGPGSAKQAALLGLYGESQGIRDAHNLALGEGRFRTGVLENNADRRLGALGMQIEGDLSAANFGLDSEKTRLGYIGQDLEERLAGFNAGLAGRDEERVSERFGWERRQQNQSRTARNAAQGLMDEYNDAMSDYAYVPGGDVTTAARAASRVNTLRARLAALGVKLPESPTARGIDGDSGNFGGGY